MTGPALPLQGALTVGIVTRNRAAALLRCVDSIRLLGDLVREVIVVDDASDEPVAPPLNAVAAGGLPLRVIERRDNPGPIVCRNVLMQEASTEAVLLLDDDAVVLDAAPVHTALGVLRRDLSVAIVGFAQAEADGSPWPAAMQPAPVDYACQVTAHIGFAHVVRRSAFLAVGGYRGAFYFYGEEKELALRVLDHGLKVIYLPHALVGHVPDPGGRSMSRVLRYTTRNNCLGTLLNDPFPLPLVVLPLRLSQYFRMRRGWAVDDPGGLGWILRQLVAALPVVRRERRAVRWGTLRRWRALRRNPLPWPAPEETP
jgi:GT2 family glycosyltransferase